MMKSRVMRWAGHVGHIGEERESQKGKRPLRTPRRRWEYNTKMDLTKIGWSGVDWINLAQDRDQWRTLANTVMNHRAP
jgi:hypothetical protein